MTTPELAYLALVLAAFAFCTFVLARASKG
jgi:hypothetical protein